MPLTDAPLRRVLLVLAAIAGIAACSSVPAAEVAAGEGQPQQSATPHALDAATARIFESVESHADTPPHGGVVVELGDHAAHAEVVMVPDTGELRVHILDGEGQPGKRIAQPSVLVDVETSGRVVTLELKAAPDAGESVGDASRFSAISEDLLRAGGATVTLRWILVDGVVYSDSLVGWGDAATE